MKAVAVAVAASLLAGCGAGMGSLVQRAAFDLDCPEEQIETQRLGDAYGVRGCGQKAVYVESCDAGKLDSWTPNCKWVRD